MWIYFWVLYPSLLFYIFVLVETCFEYGSLEVPFGAEKKGLPLVFGWNVSYICMTHSVLSSMVSDFSSCLGDLSIGECWVLNLLALFWELICYFT